MKIINYLLLFCCVSMVVYAQEKTSPEKHVAFKKEGTEPLLQREQALDHMARSVSSDGPSFDGGMRMQKITLIVTPVIEEPDAAPDVRLAPSSVRRTAQNFTFDVSATSDASRGVPPKPSLKPSASPRNSGGAVLISPKHVSAVLSPKASSSNASSRRNSTGSIDDDPETRIYLAKMCDLAGKNTKSAKQHFRRLRKQQQAGRTGAQSELPVSDSLQTIDGEAVDVGQITLDGALLNMRSREGSTASHGDIARVEWLSPSQHAELTPDTRNYLRRLKPAVRKMETTLRSQLSELVDDPKQLDVLVRDGTCKVLAPLYYAHHRTKSGTLRTVLSPEDQKQFAQEIERSLQLPCCECCSSCVIL